MKKHLLMLFLTAIVCVAQSAVNPQQKEIVVLVRKVSKGAISGTLVEYTTPERTIVRHNSMQMMGAAIAPVDTSPIRTAKNEVIVRNATNLVVVGREMRFRARKVAPLKGIEVWDCQTN